MSEFSDVEYFGELAKKYKRKIRMWPDPEEAPEVPPREILDAYRFDQLEGVEEIWPKDELHLLQELKRQIQLSENCQVAMVGQEIENRPCQPMHPRRIAHWLELLSDQPNHNDINNLEIADIFLTRKRVKVWDGEILADRWNFDPTPVVIMGINEEMPWGDQTVRGAVCSPVLDIEDVDLSDDEIMVRADDSSVWVVHLWLKFPVSTEQLHRRVGRLDESSAEDFLTAIGLIEQGLPLTEEEGAGEPLDMENELFTLERERFYERATWLCATVQSLREEWEHRITIIPKPPAVMPDPVSAFIEFAPYMKASEYVEGVAAAGGKPVSEQRFLSITKKVIVIVSINPNKSVRNLMIHDDPLSDLPSKILDGWSIVGLIEGNDNPIDIGAIEEGVCTLPYKAKAFQIITPAGIALDLKEIGSESDENT